MPRPWPCAAHAKQRPWDPNPNPWDCHACTGGSTLGMPSAPCLQTPPLAARMLGASAEAKPALHLR